VLGVIIKTTEAEDKLPVIMFTINCLQFLIRLEDSLHCIAELRLVFNNNVFT
jgi:hypothetical protein